MIDIERLKLLTDNDLARKDHAGYTSSDEFSRIVNVIQEQLFDYYIRGNEAREFSALMPFVKEADLLLVSNYADLPSDYRLKIEGGIKKVIQSGEECDYEITTTITSAKHVTNDGFLLRSESAIRRNANFYEILTNKIKSNVFDGTFYLKYYRHPTEALRAYNINVTTQEEEYDSIGSVHLEWDVSEIQNFVDLILLYKGISTRNTPLTQWVMANNNFKPTTVTND